jgi:hypothetical protein
MDERKSTGQLTAIAKLTVSITVTLVAGLAILLVLDIIPDTVFSEMVQRVLLLAVIIGLASVVLTLIARIGK